MMSKPKKYPIDIDLSEATITIHLPKSDINWLNRLSVRSYELWEDGIREGLSEIMRCQGRTIERGECH